MINSLVSPAPRNTRDIYWLAGIIEGEGNICVGPHTPALRVSMSDLDIMIRVAKILPAKVNGPYNSSKKKIDGTACKPLYQVGVTGTKAAAWLMTLYPLLGERRKAVAKEALSVWKSRLIYNRDKEFCTYGHPLNGDNLYITPSDSGRVCRTCRRRLQQEHRDRKRVEVYSKTRLISKQTPTAMVAEQTNGSVGESYPRYASETLH